MRTLLRIAFFAAFANATLVAAPAPVYVRQVGRYRLQSNSWVNLHQRLLNEARLGTASPPSLTGDDLVRWKSFAGAYRTFVGKKNPLFNKELMEMNAALSAATSSELPKSIPAAAAAVLEPAMPLYRSTQWPADDLANRFWISLADPLLVSAADELIAAHEKTYGVPFPKRILVDVSAEAGEFGAYTVGEGEFAHAVISPADPGVQGFGALESLMHEPSHAIVDANTGAIGEDLARLSRELNVKPRYNLWHALLFYTSGELTRRALVRRGVTIYRPMITEMFGRQFEGMKEAIETNWGAVLDGKMSRADAIRAILTTPGLTDTRAKP